MSYSVSILPVKSRITSSICPCSQNAQNNCAETYPANSTSQTYCGTWFHSGAKELESSVWNASQTVVLQGVKPSLRQK